ncbi:response regulator transcription factor [Micromonospora tulbaghiae]|uniref:Response regulator transcription factor n=1 Tax=Micromonospora tulbaghiae TaxID=479978 RepID=A0AAW4J9N2_9ACTN|nr:response regulator transcription factor [Micromonospora sp. AMSO1212t]MBO4138562.1 response regulator transcription factor [Micromonospora tulbaghiae]MDX5458397.1 response regulator transcription factor [Micromonospora tulbaghiae]SCE74230.1 two component transcriptional regulator, LuxR family [Micromonospora tulbaghiae]
MTPPAESDVSITIVLVDDHALFRHGLRELLSMEPDLVVLGEAGTGAEAVVMAARHRPDVMLLDAGIPGEQAAATIARTLAVAPDTRIIILSMFDEPAVVKELLGAGAQAYLVKTVTRDDLVATLRSVRGDGDRVMLSISRESFERVSDGRSSILSAREAEILALVAQAYSNSQIGRRLDITEGTVKRHLRNVFTKLGAVSRLDAVNKAVASNLITVEKPAAPAPRG